MSPLRGKLVGPEYTKVRTDGGNGNRTTIVLYGRQAPGAEITLGNGVAARFVTGYDRAADCTLHVVHWDAVVWLAYCREDATYGKLWQIGPRVRGPKSPRHHEHRAGCCQRCGAPQRGARRFRCTDCDRLCCFRCTPDRRKVGSGPTRTESNRCNGCQIKRDQAQREGATR